MQASSTRVRVGLSWHGGDADYDAYEEALQRRARALGVPLSVVWLAGKDRPSLTALLPTLNGICFTGGEDVEPSRYGRSDAADMCVTNPVRDAIEWTLLEHLERRPLPLLAICRGAQLLNVFHGGTLIPDLGELNAVHRTPPYKDHNVEVAPDTMLARLVGTGTGVINSSHHQAVDKLARGFRVSARAEDSTVEAFEPDDESTWFTLAVQWHPELMRPGAALNDGVLDSFLNALLRKVLRAT